MLSLPGAESTKWIWIRIFKVISGHAWHVGACDEYVKHFSLKKASIWQMIILQAGQTIPDPKILWEILQCGLHREPCFIPTFLWSQNFGGFITIKKGRIIVIMKEQSVYLRSWVTKVFTYDHMWTKCQRRDTWNSIFWTSVRRRSDERDELCRVHAGSAESMGWFEIDM